MKYWVGILVSAFLLFVGYWIGGSQNQAESAIIERIDTLRIEVPVERIIYKQVVRHDTVFVPQIATNDSAREDVTKTHDDSVSVVIPIERKVYEDSTFRAVISGYKPTLDTLTIYERERIVTKCPTYPPSSKFCFTAGIQMGYGFTPKGILPYTGVGVSFGLKFGNKKQNTKTKQYYE